MLILRKQLLITLNQKLNFESFEIDLEIVQSMTCDIIDELKRFQQSLDTPESRSLREWPLSSPHLHTSGWCVFLRKHSHFYFFSLVKRIFTYISDEEDQQELSKESLHNSYQILLALLDDMRQNLKVTLHKFNHNHNNNCYSLHSPNLQKTRWTRFAMLVQQIM